MNARSALRRILPATLGLGAVVVALTVGPGRAGAATEAGQLLARSIGSNYSAATTNLALAAGKSGSYGLEVKNTGTITTQYRVALGTPFGPGTYQIVAGTTVIPGTQFWTPPVAVGKTYTFTVKITVPAGTPEQVGNVAAVLTAADNPSTTLWTANLFLNMAAPAVGTQPYDTFVKNTTQPYIGGSYSEYMGAAAAKVGSTTTYSIKIQNDSTTPTSYLVRASVDPSGNCQTNAFTFAYTVAGKNVTSAITSGAYTTVVVAPTKNVTVTETVKYTLAQPGCNAMYTAFYVQASIGGSTYQYTQLPIAS